MKSLLQYMSLRHLIYENQLYVGMRFYGKNGTYRITEIRDEGIVRVRDPDKDNIGGMICSIEDFLKRGYIEITS